TIVLSPPIAEASLPALRAWIRFGIAIAATMPRQGTPSTTTPTSTSTIMSALLPPCCWTGAGASFHGRQPSQRAPTFVGTTHVAQKSPPQAPQRFETGTVGCRGHIV